MKRKRLKLTIYITSIALILTLISTSLLGGTLAKYVTSIEGIEEARTAQWGVDFTTTGMLFQKAYINDDGQVTVSGGSDFVIAPGTEGYMGGITITGIPEVAFELTFDFGSSEAYNWNYPLGENLYYEPVIWTIKNHDTKYIYEGNFENMLDVFNSELFIFYPGGPIPNISLSFAWKWPFEGNDEGDTYYGNQFINNPTEVPGFYFDLTITATQID